MKFRILCIMALFIVGCSKSQSDSPQINQKADLSSVDGNSIIRISENFEDTQCNSIDPGFSVDPDVDCWTEFLYLNNDNQQVAVHFFPNEHGDTQTVLEYENRKTETFSSFDILAFTQEAFRQVDETLTPEEEQFLRSSGYQVKLNRTKLTLKGSSLCLDHKGLSPIFGVVSICTNAEPTVAYFIKQQ